MLTVPGHIACDAASQSEIFIRLMQDGQLLGVLDIDSPEKNRFDALDQQQLEEFVAILVEHLSIKRRISVALSKN